MKNVKIISVIVIICSVIVIGALAGKHFFAYLEAKASATPGKDLRKPGDPLSAPVNQVPGKVAALGSIPGSGPTGAPSASPAGVPVSAATPVPSPLGASNPQDAEPAPTTNPSSQPVVETAKAQPVPVSDPVKAPVNPTQVDFTKEKWVAFVSGDGTNVRGSPNTEKASKVLFKVSKGTKGFVLERKDGWTKIKWDFNKKIGWTRDDLLVVGPDEVIKNMANEKGGIASFSNEAIQSANKKAAAMAKTISVAVAKPAPPSETVKGFLGSNKLPIDAVITASPFARVRESPSRKASEIGRVPKGVSVKIKAVKQVDRYNWFEITYQNGKKEGWTREDNLRF